MSGVEEQILHEEAEAELGDDLGVAWEALGVESRGGGGENLIGEPRLRRSSAESTRPMRMFWRKLRMVLFLSRSQLLGSWFQGQSS